MPCCPEFNDLWGECVFRRLESVLSGTSTPKNCTFGAGLADQTELCYAEGFRGSCEASHATNRRNARIRANELSRARTVLRFVLQANLLRLATILTCGGIGCDHNLLADTVLAHPTEQCLACNSQVPRCLRLVPVELF